MLWLFIIKIQLQQENRLNVTLLLIFGTYSIFTDDSVCGMLIYFTGLMARLNRNKCHFPESALHPRLMKPK